MRAFFYDAAVIVSVAVMTLGIIGIWRMPDVYTKLHASSKAVFLGVILLTMSSTIIAEGPIVYRAILLSLIVAITTPLSSHVIGRAAYLLQERMETPGAVDQSGSQLPERTDAHGTGDQSGTQLKDQRPTWRL